MAEIEKLDKMQIKKIIGVLSGKGGVGKSTTTVLLAEALKAKGHTVGILDADITGPSIPRLLGLAGLAGESDGKTLIPLRDISGISVISVNMFLKDEDDPVIWRGPLLGNALTQFYSDSDWGELDYLVIDFPPGTADVNLTAFQQIPLDGLVVVATAQDFVSMIVNKSVKMAQKTGVPVLGLVENMSTIVCPHCQKDFSLFAQPTEGNKEKDSVEKIALPLLAQFPWREELAQRGALVWETFSEELKDSLKDFAQKTLDALK